MQTKKILTLIFVVASFLPTFGLINIAPVEASPQTKIYFDPPISTARPGFNITIDIAIANVKNLYAFEMLLKWNATVMNWTKLECGGFLGAIEEVDWMFREEWPGWLRIGSSLVGPPEAVETKSGNGTIAEITFEVKAEGETSLEFHEPHTTLSTIMGLTPLDLEYTAISGFFTTFGPVVSFTLSPEFPLVHEEVVFNASATYDPTPGGFIANYTWDFDDETPVVTETDPIINHTFTESGNFMVVLTVFNNDGIPNTASKMLVVRPAHDIAVTYVSASPAEVAPGQIVTIDVNVTNLGAFVESFSVTVYYGDTAIETQDVVDLDPDASENLSFSWDTVDVAADTYVIKARASTVEDEVLTDNNERIDGTVTVKSTGFSMSIELIVAAVSVVAILGFLAFFFMRKR